MAAWLSGNSQTRLVVLGGNLTVESGAIDSKGVATPVLGLAAALGVGLGLVSRVVRLCARALAVFGGGLRVAEALRWFVALQAFNVLTSQYTARPFTPPLALLAVSNLAAVVALFVTWLSYRRCRGPRVGNTYEIANAGPHRER